MFTTNCLHAKQVDLTGAVSSKTFLFLDFPVNSMISKVLDIDEVVVVVDVLDRLGDGVGEGWLLQFFSLGYLSTLLQFVVFDDVLIRWNTLDECV